MLLLVRAEARTTNCVYSVFATRPWRSRQTRRGITVALGTARGRLKACHRMIDLMQQRVGEGTRIKIAHTHVAAMEQLEILRAMVVKRFECVETILTDLTPVLAVHSGPGTVGASFFSV